MVKRWRRQANGLARIWPVLSWRITFVSVHARLGSRCCSQGSSRLWRRDIQAESADCVATLPTTIAYNPFPSQKLSRSDMGCALIERGKLHGLSYHAILLLEALKAACSSFSVKILRGQQQQIYCFPPACYHGVSDKAASHTISLLERQISLSLQLFVYDCMYIRIV